MASSRRESRDSRSFDPELEGDGEAELEVALGHPLIIDLTSESDQQQHEQRQIKLEDSADDSTERLGWFQASLLDFVCA